MADEPAIRAEAEVRLWGETVGALVELADGPIVFEYADSFRRQGLEISPLHLPTRLEGPQTFEELRDRSAFQGLPGVFADALPDAFGRRVIRAYYAARGEEEKALSPVQQLLYVGRRAIGALNFHPAEEPRPAEEEALNLQELAHDAAHIVDEPAEAEVAVPEIYRIGSSAGGRRPKAIVQYDPSTGTVRSGSAERRDGEIPCILKFDGIGEDHTREELGAPQHYNRVEAAYADMAEAAGVEMPPIEVLEVHGYAHLLIRRFDIVEDRRLHQHTFGGLTHVDYNDPGASSYEEYFRVIQQLTEAYDTLKQGYRRMVFNVMAVNQDDHVKNLSFHMDRDGRWTLTPAYDVTFAHGGGYTRFHQMRIQDKRSGITEADLRAVADQFSIKNVDQILEEVRGAVEAWERFAARYDVPDRVIHGIRDELDQRAKEL
jgi:serine/threonine-protein kinase HipA